MSKEKVTSVFEILTDQINKRIRFGTMLAEVQRLGAELSIGVHFGVGDKKTLKAVKKLEAKSAKKPAKKTVKKPAKKAALKHHLSTAGRKRIIAAQRVRWAKIHAKKRAADKKKAERKAAAKKAAK